MAVNYQHTTYILLGFLVIILGILIATFFTKPCTKMVTIYPDCPTMPPIEYSDSPHGMCLLECDKYSNKCYSACNGDEDCIKNCYAVKAECYTNCLASA